MPQRIQYNINTLCHNVSRGQCICGPVAEWFRRQTDLRPQNSESRISTTWGDPGSSPVHGKKHTQVDISCKLPCGPVAEWFRRQISELPSTSGDRAPGSRRRYRAPKCTKKRGKRGGKESQVAEASDAK